MGAGQAGEKPFEKVTPPADWKISQAGVDLIKHFEGCSLKAYADPVGIWTIGWGRIVHPDGIRVKEGDTCTQEQADKWLLEDIEKEGSHFVRAWAKPAKQCEFDALSSFCYNRGAGRFRDLLRTNNILNYIRVFDYAGTPPKSLEGLARRRAAEWLMYQGLPWGEVSTVHGYRIWKEKHQQ